MAFSFSMESEVFKKPLSRFFFRFIIPIPGLIMDKIIYGLQVGSTEAPEVLFIVTGIPFQRKGSVFHLPGISVEVAEQCSSIRSSLALFIM